MLYRSCTAWVLLKFGASVGWNIPSLCSGWYAHTHTHRSTVRSCHKKKTLKYGYCYTIAVETSKAYDAVQAHNSSSRQHGNNEKREEKKKQKLNCTSLLETAVFLVPAEVGCYAVMTRTHARSLTRRNTVRRCHEGKSLRRGCCTVAA